MSSARLFVRAIVVTDGRSPYLDEVLRDLAAQEFAPDAVHVASVGGAPVQVPQTLSARLTAVPPGSTYASAVDDVLAQFPAHDVEYLWLLHDDSAPQPNALAHLAATARKRRRAAIIGGSQVRWRDPSRLISLGSTVSRWGARRVDLVDHTDIDQGQYAWRDDVLAVSMAGALVRREVWTALGGLDPAYQGFGDSAALSRLAWRAGHDVVVVPVARIRHAQLNLRGARDKAERGSHSTYLRRRTSEWYHAAAWARLWAIPLIVLWAFGSSLVRALVRVAQNEPRMSGVDLAVPWALLARLPRLPGSRARVRRNAAVPRSAVTGLLASPGTVLTHVRTRYMRAYDRWRIAVTPTGMVRAELAHAAGRRRWMLALVTTVSLGISVVIYGGWLPEIAAGRMLSGGALGVTDVPWETMWERSWSGWSESGYGAPALDGSFAAVMVPIAALPGGLRLWLGLLLVFSVTAASIAAWLAAGAATRSVAVRALVALAYAVWPTYLAAVYQGRVGAVIAHILVPLVALGVVRSMGWHRGELLGGGEEYTARRVASPSAAAAAALALAIVVSVAPVLLAPALLILAVVAVMAGRRWLRVVLTAVPALVVSGPAITAALNTATAGAAWEILAREPGPAAASAVADPWRVALGLDVNAGVDPAQWYAEPWVGAALGIAIAAFAVIALLSGRALRAVTFGWVVVGLGLGAAFAAQRTIAQWPDGAGASSANGWQGPGLSLALVGALAAIAAASHGTWRLTESRARVPKRLVGAVALTAALVVVAGTALAWAWPSRPPAGDVIAAPVEVLPLVARLDQDPPQRARVMRLTDADGGVVYSVEHSDGAQTLTGSAVYTSTGAPAVRPDATDRATPAQLAPAVAQLVGSGQGADEELAAWGIGVIVTAPGSGRAQAGISQVDSLTLMGASEFGTSYRVGGIDAPVRRAWIDVGDTVIPLNMQPQGISQEIPSGAGTLIIAAAADPSWQASIGGVPLASVDDDLGRQAFAVPAGGGSLEAAYHDRDYRRWWWAAAIACGLALLAALPLHDRRLLGARA